MIAIRDDASRPAATTDAAIADVRSMTDELDDPTALTALREHLADSQVVMFGEASHGTSEYYQWRSRLSAQLLREHEFDFVAVEGDWTDCFAVNRYVKGFADAALEARDALSAFERWPTWLWANWEVLEFVDWLASHNETRGTGEMAGFYGLDVYSLFESMQALVDYLEGVDPDAATEAREAYRCFEPYGDDARAYARSIRFAPKSCEDEVVEVLSRLTEDGRGNGDEGDHPDERFSAEQNALVAKNAEAYYRAMVDGDSDSWNVRDRHMTDTLSRLLAHHESDARGIVWAHNTHVGDARATDMERRGRHNIGQLARERSDFADVTLVGFGSHHGSVVAAESWDAPMERLPVPPAKTGSYEDVFHRAGGGDRVLVSDELGANSPLATERGHRAIGVVYDPDREDGNYVPTVLPERYDVFVYLEETSALHPLEMHAEREEVPELYPWGF
ncbi:erythromycin esterase family protein [Halobacteria archaeon AArc-m2/3/4]|uniref:Erythromycin esterase family protein n=1 Tax=Natronoglomus mannanivorans TaxID=2979990 RepID=A0ABT2QJZ1_9EURY|nr:erythromycin esterase family protein [Halobacteria archaeon AArc-m2/3/4]